MRGVGVINVERMFGIGSFASRAEIALHIVLEAFDDSKAYDRIGIEQKRVFGDLRHSYFKDSDSG